jgi:hypothetical protein
MPRRKKKRPVEEKRPIELTDDEALEHLYSKEVRDKLKEAAETTDRVAKKADRTGKKSPHK